MTPMEIYLHDRPVLALAFMVFYTWLLGRVLVAVIGAFRRPSNPEALMTPTQRLRWKTFERVSRLKDQGGDDA